MSITGSRSNMGTPFFREFKKQASFFFKEKINTARLALTDVTPTQLLTEDATNGRPWAPDARTLKLISRAAFEIDDYWRIVEILHKRLTKFDKRKWRSSYNALIVLEYLLTHGPESIAEEFQTDIIAIRDIGSFQHIDEKGFNWGLSVRKKSERTLKLLEKGPLLKEEREKARKITRGIQGFGSFTHRPPSILQESSSRAFGRRCNSQFDHHENENQEEPIKIEGLIQNGFEKIDRKSNENVNFFENFDCEIKENMAPKLEVTLEVTEKGEARPLLGDEKYGVEEEDKHPFNGDEENLSSVSLISRRGQVLQAC